MTAARRIDALQQLRKVLELERKRGFDDKAVFGGLDKLLVTLLEQNGIAKDSPIARVASSLPAGGYRTLDAAERQRWLNEALAALSRRPSPKPAPRPSQPGEPKAPAPKPGVDAPITVLKGVKGATAEKFEKLGVSTVRDLLYYFPRRHNDYANLQPIAELQPGEEHTVRARVWSAEETQLGRTMRGTVADVGDESGMMRVVWFRQPWLAKQLKINSEVVLAGRVSLYKGRPTFENPEWEPVDAKDEHLHTGALIPVYSTTEGISSRPIRRAVRQALDAYANALADPLPQELRDRLRLMDVQPAVRQAHYPDSQELLAEARRRLAIDELLPLQLSVVLRRQRWQQPGTADAIPMAPALREGFLAALPFALTGAQERALEQLLADLARDMPMSRLLQGDVGSGKTVVAAAGLIAAVASGHQAVLMAPTEILAQQHFRTLRELFAASDGDAPLAEAAPPYLGRPLRIARLTGSARASEKAALYEQIERGEIDIVTGTHALIQEGLSFSNLGFVIVDEQHRFGVMQRAALRTRSARSAHMLVMTATPIPRSLYLTLYGDLDVSVIDELPPGRKPVETKWWPPERRDETYAFLQKQIEAGRQAFIICPLVEESETLQAKSAVQEFERLQREVFPDLSMALVHGRLPAKEKDAVMQRFRAGEAQILVATAVVEVGIDVPNATVMLIESADRFGLAQLHQFRGRVGRGADQSYCLLLAESPSADAQQRLRLMEETTDGFRLAEADLHMRGPGEFFGTRQSGLPDFRVASLFDTRLIELARREGERILDADPGLAKPEHTALAAAVARLFDQVTGEVH